MRKRPRLTMSFYEQLMSKPLEVTSRGAHCMTCLKPTDEEHIVEEWRSSLYGGRNGMRYLVRCHGAEETRDFEFGSGDWDHTDQQRALQRVRWFDPQETAGNVIGSDKLDD